MNNCGKRFHGEAAKYRFLNELLKLLTPKYFGSWTPQKVKDRVTEVLYGWTLWLKDEPKIQEAYRMLKKQGIVKKDPKLPDTVITAPPTQRTTDSVFDQEDKATLLARLLKSTCPEDLEAANRLIKSTIREEQEKAEKVSKRESTLKEVESSTEQLRQLLDRHAVAGTSVQPSDDAKARRTFSFFTECNALYERCDRLRPSLFRLAGDTMDDDAALAQILAANDELTRIVSAYKHREAKRGSDGGSEGSKEAPESPREIRSYRLIDLSAMDSDPPPSCESSSASLSSLLESTFHPAAERDLNELAGVAPLRSLPHNQQFTAEPQNPLGEPSGRPAKENPLSPRLLKDVFVPMETIKSSSLEPITVTDHGGVHVSLHFARDSPPGHPGVAVVVVSAVNASALHVHDFLFQAAVPKTMLVKLQPASGTELRPYNPLLPPPAISQVLLLANPQRLRLRLRYKLTLTHGDRPLSKSGEVDDFPDWTSLIGR
ncbi:ADP-ribosylation factor-binding protein GGA2 [Liparis tanakae]|uniref:ADP-ribosylation factor-binding protein GGA2 n=1 Tax=Liparis tanakae TaxID=230148 RepID=A0A4Z2EUM0_9TELE|nr:ADP-ribosylation factor-binding protein GGA2 [Liparis tanakae]